MITELQNTEKAEPLFQGWEETMILSCLQKMMGRIFVTDENAPASAFAFLGGFGFLGGRPDRELLEAVPGGSVILTPQNEAWEKEIEAVFPEAGKRQRYAIRKDTVFDPKKLREYLSELPEGYEIRKIDRELYDRCLSDPATSDFVSVFENREDFLRKGFGWVITKNGRIVSGASSYSRYREGIEVEVDTVPEERRKHLALIACSRLILDCLDRGLYPSWDAQNLSSVRLAEKLGYRLSHAYTVYDLDR